MFVLVLAKEPRPGRVKTRLCPPCSPTEAASIAEAALHDTFAAATASGADEVIAAIDGEPGDWLPPGVRVVSQVTGSFDRRLAGAWATTSGAGVQIGMDTPQATAADLDAAMNSLDDPSHDAVLGHATDGGWWIIGLSGADERVFLDVAMSRPDTGQRQQERLESLGFRVARLPTLTDVDHFPEATVIAEEIPHSRFAAAVRSVQGVGAGAH